MGCNQSTAVPVNEPTPASSAPVAAASPKVEAPVVEAPASQHQAVEAEAQSTEDKVEATEEITEQPAEAQEETQATATEVTEEPKPEEVVEPTLAETETSHEETPVTEEKDTAAEDNQAESSEPAQDNQVEQTEETDSVQPAPESSKSIKEEEKPEEPVPEPEEPSVVIDDAPKSTKHEDAGLSFIPSGTVEKDGVVYYTFKSSSSSGDVVIQKRYNEFKAFHAQMAAVMANAENVPEEDKDKFATYPALPAMPKASLKTVMKGRRNQELLKEREAQFLDILNAIARHPTAASRPEFQSFLA